MVAIVVVAELAVMVGLDASRADEPVEVDLDEASSFLINYFFRSFT